MPFKQLITDLVSEAIVIVDDLADAVVYTSITSIGEYDPTTDTRAQTTVIKNFNAVLAAYSEDEIDNSAVVKTDMKMILSSKDFGAGKPEKNDTLTAQSRTWHVQDIKGVPGESAWFVQIRPA